MLNIDWRSSAAYGHAKAIPAAGFAWEYLRRNDDYRHDFQTIGLTGHPRTDRHSLQPSHGCGEVDESSEVNSASVVTGSETAKVLETVEAALDSVAVFVETSVMRDDDFARPV